ncbi:hypothetical protein BVRB_035280, partial [Beta vulgaris subsp. vulgaris]
VDDEDEVNPDGNIDSESKFRTRLDSNRAASENSWRKEQFMPELWSSKDPDTDDFFRRSAQEIGLCSKPRSVRVILPHPECMVMQRRDGNPGNNIPDVEPQYLPMQSQILATMHASSDRFRTGHQFQVCFVIAPG